MSCELLVPAGNMDCLRQAVFHGADAVYLACKNFGARKFATNFTNDEILEAISFCHLYGVKIYVTMNTLVKNQEVDHFLEQARFLHKNGVDALIVQDFGMICLLREMFPNLEIHASTQANISSYETCKMYYELGVKRVVFSRELSIDEIDAIDVPIEKEVFIHGALCVSYSGCCLMSSMLGGRSGNRGECAGSCRLPYSLLKEGKEIQKECYLLSMKELNTSSFIDRLLKSNLSSLKIEGRMKGALYVGFITQFYRKLIDGEEIDYSSWMDALKTIFNREFTRGHLFGASGGELISRESCNHLGLRIGKAICRGGKIEIHLDPGQILRQNDAIRFVHQNKGMIVNYLYDEKDRLCSSSTGVCSVDNKVGLREDDLLSKTQDSSLEKEVLLKESLYKVPISFSVLAKENEELSLTISDGEITHTVLGGVVEKAKSSPITEEVLSQKLAKLGNTPFTLKDFSVQMDSSVFFPMTVLNDLRREAVSYLEKEREKNKIIFVEKEVSFSKSTGSYPTTFSCRVMKEEQLKCCLGLSFERIYVPDLSLYQKYKEYPNIIYDVGHSSYSLKEQLQERNRVSDTQSSFSCYGSYGLNVTNIYTGYYLQKMGYLNIPLSVELNSHEILEYLTLYREKFGDASFEIFTYGRVLNMLILSNILGIEEGNLQYQLMDSKKRCFPVFYDGRVLHIYNHEVTDIHSLFDSCCAFFDFTFEKPEEILEVVKRYQEEKKSI